MGKYYRVKKDTFLWKEGAILELGDMRNDCLGYQPIEDIRDITPVQEKEYITQSIVEHPSNTDYFERVYKDTVAGNIYKTADELRETYSKAFTK